MPLTIRPATEEAQPTINRLIKEANLNRMSLHWPNFVVAECGGAIIGVGQVKTHGDGSRELASIVVVPERQGHGVGSAIIEALLARESGVILYLTCRSELEGYYMRFGFRRIERAEYPPYFGRLVPLINMAMRFLRMRIIVMRREAAG